MPPSYLIVNFHPQNDFIMQISLVMVVTRKSTGQDTNAGMYTKTCEVPFCL